MSKQPPENGRDTNTHRGELQRGQRRLCKESEVDLFVVVV